MQIIDDLATLNSVLQSQRLSSRTLALVPTMGALHAGHLSLIALAQQHADDVIASIFVNSRQFGPDEDYEQYPRTLAQDAELLVAAGVAYLWAPPATTMYQPEFSTSVHVAVLGDQFCGTNRPGHFDGVATVVTLLFGQIRPDFAVFGEKDFQQLAIIKRLTADLNLGVTIIGSPILRETDGLAHSSRNAYLNANERRIAPWLVKTLTAARDALEAGIDVNKCLKDAEISLLGKGFSKVDYLALVDPQTLRILDKYDDNTRLLAAAWLGKTRLIDNIAVGTAR